jgi:hypothetical protein
MINQQDALYERWGKWLELLANEVIELFTRRSIFGEVQEIIKNNIQIQTPGDFNEWMAINYAAAMSVAVRKQAMKDDKGISFRTLLEEIKSNPKVISRARFKKNFVSVQYEESTANLCFDDIAGKGCDYLEVADIDKDIQTLITKTSALTKYVNKRIAHHDQKEFADIPTFKDLHEAVDYLEVLLKKYWLIFTALETQALPVWHYDWQAVFRYPWII